MIVIITGASHTGKTVLAQRMVEKYKYPYVSIDHLKMGLIRSGNTNLTPEDDDELVGYLWPIVREMIKTAIENRQNLIVEGCYIPYDWRKGFDNDYLSEIRFICLAMTDAYIDAHFDDIRDHGSDIENRLDDSDCTADWLKEDNRKIIEVFSKAGEQIILIDTDYESLISALFEENEKMLRTERLILRRWEDSDAEDLYKYASDPDVGPIAGWPPHQSVDESRDVIKNVFNGKEAYAICLKEDGKAIGAIELKLNGHTDMTDRDDECELGYWLGKPFLCLGIMPEAVKEMLRHAFEDCGMQKVWIGYYEGNNKSKRVQEKCGFKYQWRSENVDVPLMHEKRTGHVSLMTKEDWNPFTCKPTHTEK